MIHKRYRIYGLSNVAVMVAIVLVLMLVMLSVVYYTTEKNRSSNKSTITIIDDYGRTDTIPSNPQRIVTFGPSATEVVFSLGLGNKVVGVDNDSDYPAEAKSITKVGVFSIDFETIVVLHPDVIVAADVISNQDLAKLSSDGYPTVVLSPKSIFGVLQDIRLIGLVTGTKDVADNVTAALQKRIDAVSVKLSVDNLTHPKVYLEYYPMWTFGPGSIGNELILAAGGLNIASNTTTMYPEISDETVIVSNPDVIIYTLGQWTTTTNASIKARSGWDVINAVKKDKIYSIDDNIIDRPGPRVVDGLEALVKLIHPELSF